MALFKRRGKKGRVFVLSIDGVPHSFLAAQMAQGRLSNLSKLVAQGSFVRMRSVLPTISSVAWSTFMTGKNPAKHGIFGFVDRRPNSYEMFIPTSLNMTAKTLWEMLSEQQRRVVVINVPVTYPVRPVNGVLVSGFLATSLRKATHPADIAQLLEQMGYRIDADAALARESLDKFLDDLRITLEKRLEAMYYFMDHQPWDYFHVHVMGTDRINHFMWTHMEQGHPRYGQAFLDYYEQIDQVLGLLPDKLDDDVTFILMSDHGFCSVKREVNLSRFLVERGWLKFKQEPPKGIGDMDAASRAYTLIPGRVYLNLKGREPQGSVEPADYEQVRQQLIEELMDLRLPDDGQRFIHRVARREEIYRGEHLSDAADLIAVPFDGYDLKADVKKDVLAEKTALEGMHTYDDAFVYMRGRKIVRQDVEIADLLPTICHLMDVPIPNDVDGHVML
jgi:predicted AlkP superfamily phosphohydrolase/phosphomutase